MSANALSDTLYMRFRDLLAQRSGLAYPDQRRVDLAHGLQMALASSPYPDLETLYAEAAQGGAAWSLLVEHLTIGETYFFLHAAQFDALRTTILPELVGRRERGTSALRSLRIWSAGCATGEEPYSLAMLLHELVPNLPDWFVTILGTDINESFLARAREASYSAWSFRETSAALRERWFSRDGARWRLRPEARRMVTFAPLNLVGTSYPAVANGTLGLDLILCRNVTIYFDEATTRQIVDRMYEALAPGGWLVVGHAEPQAAIYRRFERHAFPNTIVYRKPDSAPAFRVAPLAAPEPRPAPPAPRPAPQSMLARIIAADRQPAADHSSIWQGIDAALDAGSPERAEGTLTNLLRTSPHDARALCALARIRADRGDLASAQQLCAQVRRHHPLYRDGYFLSAQLHEHQSEWDLAIAAYRHAVFLDPSFVAGIVGMARAYDASGHTSQAQRCYRNALKQLQRIPAETPLPELAGATAGELVRAVERQLQLPE